MDQLHYELLTLEHYIPSSNTNYLHNYKCKNKFFQAFIKHKVNRISSMCSTILIDTNKKLQFACTKAFNKSCE